MLLVLDTWSNMTPKYGTNFLLLEAITNEKDVKFIQLDTMPAALYNPDSAWEGCNNSGEHTLLSLYTLGSNWTMHDIF